MAAASYNFSRTFCVRLKSAVLLRYNVKRRKLSKNGNCYDVRLKNNV
nr:MAG TPA: hypothetical protein [Caudoviricetes sp.]DAT76681.1 MAG TPA: hypothetical protein [Caudoviricetes sp.]